MHLVIGISSSGKSTLINEMSSKNKNLNVVMASKLDESQFNGDEIVVHYNLFRAYENHLENIDRPLLNDEKLKLILNHAEKVKATMVVVSKSEALKRAILRSKVEPLFRLSIFKNYPSHDVFDLINEIDYEGIHKEAIELLKAHDIPVSFVSDDDDANPLSEAEALDVVNSQKQVEYSEDEVKKILKSNRFEYQKVDLPYGLSTRGQERNQTADIILEEDFSGKSILDIGCAYGYFCFKVEEQGAKRVVGTEIKPDRFRGASLIKQVKGSGVEFIRKDIFSEKLDEKFDVVLLLNVIHHLPFPLYALNEIAKLCNEKLILEYPNTDDKKFQSTISGHNSQVSQPFIGVSKLSEVDQTFVFNDSAIERILVHNLKVFKRVEFKPSPFELNRSMAYCYK